MSEPEIETKPKTIRKPGAMKGQIEISADFDEPMSQEELDLWYEAPIFPDDETQNKQDEQ